MAVDTGGFSILRELTSDGGGGFGGGFDGGGFGGGFDGGGYGFSNSFGDFGGGGNFSSGAWDLGNSADWTSWQSEPSDYRSNIADARTEGRTSNYQGTETKFNPDIGKIEPNIFQKGWNYLVDNAQNIAPVVGGLVAGPLGAVAGTALGGYAAGKSPEEIAKSSALSLVSGQLGKYLGGALAGENPFVQGAVGSAANTGIAGLINTGDINLGAMGQSALVGGIGRGVGAEFGPVAGSIAGGLAGGQDPSSVLGNAALGLAKSEFNKETFPGAANLASNAWDYFKPRDFAISDYLPGSTGDISDLGSIFAQGPSYAPGELDRIQMSYGPRDPVGYVPDRNLIGDYVTGGGASAPSPAPSSAPVAAAPATQAPAVQPAPAQDNSGLMTMLLAMGLMGDEGQDQAPVAPQVFQAPQMATLPGQLPGQLGGQPTSLAELMALLNTRRA